MSVTFSNITGLESNKTTYTFSNGPLTQAIKRVTLDSSAPSGGYGSTLGLSPGAFGLKTIIGMQILNKRSSAAQNYNFSWDGVNNKLIVSKVGGLPSMVVEEVVTIAAGAGRLAYPPAYIFTAEATAGSVTGTLRIIPTGEAPATKQMAVTLTTGVIATNVATDALTAIKVSYIPLGVGPFIEANRVVDESNTGTNDTTRQLANRAALVQYFWNDTAGTLPTFVPVGESPGSGEVACDINSSGDTVFTVNAAQDDATYKITYWKFSAIGAAFGWTDDADTTITSTSLFSIADNIAVPPQGIWIPALGNVLVGEATATNKQAIIVGPTGTAGADIAVYDPVKGNIAFTAGDGYTTLAMAYMFLNAEQISQNTGEVPAGTNLSSVTIDIMAIGRPS